MCPVWHSSPMRWYSLPACWHRLPACWHSFGFGLDMDRIWFLSAAPKQAPQQGLVRKLAAPKPRGANHQTKGGNLPKPRGKSFPPWFRRLPPLVLKGPPLGFGGSPLGFPLGFGRLPLGFKWFPLGFPLGFGVPLGFSPLDWAFPPWFEAPNPRGKQLTAKA